MLHLSLRRMAVLSAVIACTACSPGSQPNLSDTTHTKIYPQKAVVRLYSDKAPGSEGWTHHEVQFNEWGDTAVFANVVDPEIIVYLPDADSATAACIICPGGSYGVLSGNNEGVSVAQQLCRHGIAGILLKYRTAPLLDSAGNSLTESAKIFNQLDKVVVAGVAARITREKGRNAEVAEQMLGMPNAAMAHSDGLRAIECVRQNAKQWNINPQRVGIMGFSAGAVLAMNVGMVHTPANRPDFVAPIYGGWPAGLQPPADAAPLFVCSPARDVFPTDESYRMYRAWLDRGLPVELHYFGAAQHGFGGEPRYTSADRWIDMLCSFLQDNGLLKK